MIQMRNYPRILTQDLSEISKLASPSLDILAGKNVLLTGGGGFLGYELAHTLAEIGSQDGRTPLSLTIYDNFLRGKRGWLTQLEKRPNVRLVQHDITLPIPDTCPKFSYIIHAASVASPSFYRRYPVETIDANVIGLRNILNYMQTRQPISPVEGMLFFSSSEIYGDPSADAIPTPETYRGFVSCTGPRACYDESKRLGETLCVTFARQFGCRVVIARPFNNFGPGMDIDDRRLLPDLVRDITNDRDLVLLSDGSATRTFCYISDAIIGYLKVLTHGESGEAYNIGTDFPEVSVAEFVERVAKISKSRFKYAGKILRRISDDPDYLTDNPTRRCPDIGKARSKLGYAPQVGLDDGLERTLAWFAEERQ